MEADPAKIYSYVYLLFEIKHGRSSRYPQHGHERVKNHISISSKGTHRTYPRSSEGIVAYLIFLFANRDQLLRPVRTACEWTYYIYFRTYICVYAYIICYSIYILDEWMCKTACAHVSAVVCGCCVCPCPCPCSLQKGHRRPTRRDDTMWGLAQPIL